MTPVKLPGRGGWLCGDCATRHRWHFQVRECCSGNRLTRGDYALLVVAFACAALFVGSIFVSPLA